MPTKKATTKKKAAPKESELDRARRESIELARKEGRIKGPGGRYLPPTG